MLSTPQTPPGSSGLDDKLRALLSEALGLPAERVAAFSSETALFGALPELD